MKYLEVSIYDGACRLLREAGTLRPVRQPAGPVTMIGVMEAGLELARKETCHASHFTRSLWSTH